MRQTCGCLRVSVQGMSSHRLVALLCGVVVLVAVVLAMTVSAWALVVVPFALVIGIASWRGVSVGRTLDVLGDSGNDPGSGPAGIMP